MSKHIIIHTKRIRKWIRNIEKMPIDNKGIQCNSLHILWIFTITKNKECKIPEIKIIIPK